MCERERKREGERESMCAREISSEYLYIREREREVQSMCECE